MRVYDLLGAVETDEDRSLRRLVGVVLLVVDVAQLVREDLRRVLRERLVVRVVDVEGLRNEDVRLRHVDRELRLLLDGVLEDLKEEGEEGIGYLGAIYIDSFFRK